MKTNSYKLSGLTLATTNTDEMVAFYSGVFQVQFTSREMYGSKLFFGQLSDMQFVICPADVAGIKASQNRHQIEFLVTDIEYMLECVKSFGGTSMSAIAEDATGKSVGIYDPDRNSIVLKEVAKVN